MALVDHVPPKKRTSRNPAGSFGFIKNGDDRDRTDNPLLAKQVLSQLSYAPVNQDTGISIQAAGKEQLGIPAELLWTLDHTPDHSTYFFTPLNKSVVLALWKVLASQANIQPNFCFRVFAVCLN